MLRMTPCRSNYLFHRTVFSEALEQDRSIFTQVPKDLFLKILSYFTPPETRDISRVCKTWYNDIPTALNVRLREITKIDLAQIESFFLFAIVKLLQKNLSISYVLLQCKQLRVLDLSNLNACDQDLEELSGKNYNLREIYLSDAQISDKGIDKLVRFFPKLQIINLENCEHITDVSLESISTHCAELCELNLAFCERITAKGVRSILTLCTNLVELDLTDFQKLDLSIIHLLMQRQETLEHLDLSFCEFFDNEMALLMFTNAWPNLISLVLIGCDLTDEAVKQILISCQDLIIFELNNCSQVSDLGLSYIAEYGKQIKFLSFGNASEVTDQGLDALSLNCSALIRISFSNCDKITEIGLRSILEQCAFLEIFKIETCKNISEEFVKKAEEQLSTRLRG